MRLSDCRSAPWCPPNLASAVLTRPPRRPAVVVAPHHMLRCQPDPRIPTAVSPPPAPAALTLPRSGAGGSASASASATRAMLAYTPSSARRHLHRRRRRRLHHPATSSDARRSTWDRPARSESMAKAITQQPRNYSGSEYAKGVKKLEGLVRGLLSDYVREHSSVAAGGAARQRGVRLWSYSCPPALPTLSTRELSAFALAVVDNRPFVAEIAGRWSNLR